MTSPLKKLLVDCFKTLADGPKTGLSAARAISNNQQCLAKKNASRCTVHALQWHFKCNRNSILYHTAFDLLLSNQRARALAGGWPEAALFQLWASCLKTGSRFLQPRCTESGRVLLVADLRQFGFCRKSVRTSVSVAEITSSCVMLTFSAIVRFPSFNRHRSIV